MNNIQMIFGAPGCGKTTYLINLLSKLLQTNEPDKIAFVSFTRKGSYEGRDRAIKEFGLKENDFPYFRTIHSLAFRNLGISKYEMISKRNYKDFSKAMGMNFVGYYTEDFVNNDDKYLFYCSLENNNPETSKRMLTDLDFSKLNIVKSNYIRFKKEMGIRDFDDLLIEFIKKDTPLPIDIAIIDEAQDLSSLQWKFCEVAFKNCKQVFIAGDDDQAIYEWNGSDLKKFLSLNTGDNIKILDQSFRLKKSILSLSKKISRQIKNRVVKNFDPISEGGKIFYYNNIEDIPINNEESFYFLSRNNYFLHKYKSLLMKKRIVFRYKGKHSVDEAFFNAIRRYEYLRKHDPIKISKEIKLKPYLKKDRKKDSPWFEAMELDLDISNYYRDLIKNKVDIKKSLIDISTIHGVKGGEANNVILMLDMTRNVYNNLNQSQNNYDSELRCLYVALTRTKNNLHIVYSNSKFGYDEIIRRII